MKLFRCVLGVVSIGLLLGFGADAQAGTRRKAKVQARQTATETAHGQQIIAAYLEDHEVVKDTRFNEVMDRVFQRLIHTPEVSARNFQYEIHLVKSDEANAFAAPGGKVVVLSGITSILREDEDMWAALLAHELAHAVRSHTLGQQKKTKKLGFGVRVLRAAGGLAPGLAGAGGKAASYADVAKQAGQVAPWLNVVNPFLARKFSRSDESDADAQGMLYMASAGFDPQAAIRFHEELERRFASNQKAFGTFFRTHPREAVRIQRLTELLPVVTKMASDAAPGQAQEVRFSSTAARNR